MAVATVLPPRSISSAVIRPSISWSQALASVTTACTVFFRRQDIGRFDLGARDREGRRDLDPGVPVDAGIGQIVDLPSEGRDFGVFRPVQNDRQQVVTGAEPVGQPGVDRRISVLVGGNFRAVQVDPGIRHHRVEPQRHLLAVPGGIGADQLLIGVPALVGRLIRMVVGQIDRVMGQSDRPPAAGLLPQFGRIALVELPVGIDVRCVRHRAFLFDCTQHALDELALEDEEDEKRGQGGQDRRDHQSAIVGQLLRPQRRDGERDGFLVVGLQDDQRPEVAVPLRHEHDDRRGGIG